MSFLDLGNFLREDNNLLVNHTDDTFETRLYLSHTNEFVLFDQYGYDVLTKLCYFWSSMAIEYCQIVGVLPIE